MAWKQLVPPDLSIRVWAGWCLSLARQVARAPAREATAWDAWMAVKHRHGPGEPIPNVPVILWLSHWNTYNGTYKNWGHVVYWIPGRGFLSSPGSGYGQEWLSSVAAVIARFGGAYVGWSEDISTQRVAQLVADAPAPQSASSSTNQSTEEEEQAMLRGLTYTTADGKSRMYMLFNPVSGFYSEFSNGAGRGPMPGSYINPIAQNWETKSWPTVTAAHAARLKADLDKVRKGI
ncbi:hypothetical protein U6G28_02670 [Actinomycetaceae bacterium MB13-C1-2]|nr:hypothetical protein U6G28_02670 [Actinomycetaceae bacterium MB13-C1-2]